MFRLSLVLMTVLSVASPVNALNWKFWQKPAPATQVSKKDRARVEKDVQRLQTLLTSVKNSPKMSAKSLQSTASEADVIAARILTNVRSATTEKGAVKRAEQLRTHVKNMRAEAFNGHADKSRKHANSALKVASKLDGWAQS